MSNNNNNGEMMGIAIVAAIIGLAAIFLYAVAAFLALGLTVVAFCAWDKPRTIFGNVLTPAEARAFVGRGILGAILLPVFAVFCAAMFDLRIEDQYWPHIILGGYTLGSLGLAMMEADNQKPPQSFEGMTIEADPIRPTPPAQPQQPARGFDEQSAFRFASWDDEEELKR